MREATRGPRNMRPSWVGSARIGFGEKRRARRCATAIAVAYRGAVRRKVRTEVGAQKARTWSSAVGNWNFDVAFAFVGRRLHRYALNPEVGGAETVVTVVGWNEELEAFDESRLNVVSGVATIKSKIENAWMMLTTMIWFLYPSVLWET